MPFHFSRRVVHAAFVAVVFSLLLGCDTRSVGPSGPTDARLHGKWQYNFGLADRTVIDFRNDGTAQVTHYAGGDKTGKSYVAKWYVETTTKDGVNINMQKKGTAEYEVRKIKFIKADYMEMKFGSKMGRFEKIK